MSYAIVNRCGACGGCRRACFYSGRWWHVVGGSKNSPSMMVCPLDREGLK